MQTMLVERLVREIARWDGVEVAAAAAGSGAVRVSYRGSLLGAVDGAGQAVLPFPWAVCAVLERQGHAVRTVGRDGAGEVTIGIVGCRDAALALHLFRLGYERAVDRAMLADRYRIAMGQRPSRGNGSQGTTEERAA